MVCENTDSQAPAPEFLIQLVWAGARVFAFLTSSQVVLKLLSRDRPLSTSGLGHFKGRCYVEPVKYITFSFSPPA